MLDTTLFNGSIFLYRMYRAFDTSLLKHSFIFVIFLQGKVLSHYFTTKQYRIKRFSGVHACVHGADSLVHTLSAPFWEMVMLENNVH
jgi:hypothetical protein